MAVLELHGPLAQSQRELEEMLVDGRPFERLESAIDGAPFNEEDRAALWLYAWSLDELRKRRPVRPRRRFTSVEPN